MIRHILLLAIRNFKKYKSSFIINITGLSTGLACTLLIFLWVDDELKMDKFHAKEPRLYQVLEHQQYADNIMTTTSTPGILAEALAEEIPEIEYAATTTWVGDYTLSIETRNIKAEGFHVGKDFFNIFSFDLVEGQPDQVLADKKSIVISQELAVRLFGESGIALGQEVVVQHEHSFLVTGIFKDIPRRSSIKFDFVLPFEFFKDENEWVTQWGNNGPPTYVILHNEVNANELSEKIAGFVKDKNEGESNVTLFLKRFSERYLYGRYRDGKPAGGRIEYVQLFSIIAAFILIIACINFMNLSTARASRRAKEVGIKKAVGAFKKSLIYQYLVESTLVALISLLLAFVMVLLFLPEFNDITDKRIILQLTPAIIQWSLGITLFTGLLAGSYPAFYLSGFKPVEVLKGNLRGSIGELWARRGLVVAQFTISVVLIVAVLVIFNQIQYVQTKNLGYNKDNMIRYTIEGELTENTETYLEEVRNIPGVVNASSLGHNLIHRMNNTSGLEWEGKDPEADILFENVRVNHGILETLEVQLKEGRFFSQDFSTDTTKIIFNEAGIDVMGMEDPIGQTIRLWDQYDLEIIGVVKDFHFQSLHQEVKPLFFLLTPESTWNVMVRIEQGREKETLEALEAHYKEFNPGFAFDFQFQDVEYAKIYAAEQRVGTLSRYFAIIAIIISCLGLFGLAAFTAERRLKEIGIRKAMGSSVTNIVMLLTSDFTRLVAIAIVVAVPISYLAISVWLERFAFHIDLAWWFFVGAGLIALLIAWLTIGFQALKAARVNPSDCLRNE